MSVDLRDLKAHTSDILGVPLVFTVIFLICRSASLTYVLICIPLCREGIDSDSYKNLLFHAAIIQPNPFKLLIGCVHDIVGSTVAI